MGWRVHKGIKPKTRKFRRERCASLAASTLANLKVNKITDELIVAAEAEVSCSLVTMNGNRKTLRRMFLRTSKESSNSDLFKTRSNRLTDAPISSTSRASAAARTLAGIDF